MTLLRFVLHEDVQFYEAEGWVVSSDLAGTYHGRLSVLMERADLENLSQESFDIAPLEKKA